MTPPPGGEGVALGWAWLVVGVEYTLQGEGSGQICRVFAVAPAGVRGPVQYQPGGIQTGLALIC